MKKILSVIALCVMTFWGSYTLNAGNFGVVGGANFTGVQNISLDMTTGYHAGFTYKFHLPFGFAIQPHLVYNMKASVVETAIETGSALSLGVGYIEFPVSFQWGPDLLLFRPFFDVTPFVGYAVNNEFQSTSALASTVRSWKNEWNGMNRLEYGIGLGGGLEIWKLQIVARYNWNFGPLFNAEGKMDSWSDMVDNVKTSVLKGNNFGGVTLSVALLF